MLKPNEAQVLEFIKLFNEMSGIDLMENKNTLVIKLDNFLKDKHFATFKDFLTRLQFDRALKQEVIDLVTVNETYFHRELKQLKDSVFYIKSLERPTKVLSAPCSTGEEVYSFAILAAQNGISNLHITGIDISADAIQKAKHATYQGRTLNHLSEADKKHYFENEGNAYKIKKSQICHCHFELCNVFEPKFLKLGKFDLILSRNMMIYFDYENKMKLMQRFHQITSTGARLYIGNSDLAPENEYFTKIFAPLGGTYYLRND